LFWPLFLLSLDAFLNYLVTVAWQSTFKYKILMGNSVLRKNFQWVIDLLKVIHIF
jgi:hypothetical protein